MKMLLLVATMAAHAADAASTASALRHGAVEGNPFMRQPVVRWSAKAGVAGLETYAVARLWRTGHHRMAAILTGATVAGLGLAVAHNVHLSR